VVEASELRVDMLLLLWSKLGDVAVENNFFHRSFGINTFGFLCVRDCCFVTESNNFLNSSLSVSSFNRLKIQQEAEYCLKSFLRFCEQIFVSNKEMRDLFSSNVEGNIVIFFDIFS
jgi:hypothetical protein